MIMEARLFGVPRDRQSGSPNAYFRVWEGFPNAEFRVGGPEPCPDWLPSDADREIGVPGSRPRKRGFPKGDILPSAAESVVFGARTMSLASPRRACVAGWAAPVAAPRTITAATIPRIKWACQPPSHDHPILSASRRQCLDSESCRRLALFRMLGIGREWWNNRIVD